MLEFGIRLTNDFYIKVAIENDLSESVVTVETLEEGEPVITTGTITWNDGE